MEKRKEKKTTGGECLVASVNSSRGLSTIKSIEISAVRRCELDQW